MVTAAEVRLGTHLILILKGSTSTVAWDTGFEAGLLIAQAAPELVAKILAELEKLKPHPLPEDEEKRGIEAMVQTWREVIGG